MACETGNNDTRLSFRLSAEIKETIEVAATYLGQSVNDFAVSTLAQAARQVIQERDITRLSQRDRDRFLALLDDTHIEPNAALVRAVKKAPGSA
jgi:uncharacterized protein (DUF1778 family)